MPPGKHVIYHFTQIVIFSWGLKVSKGLLYLFCCNNFLYKSRIMTLFMMDYGTLLHKCELKTLMFNLRSIISADWICPGMQEMSLSRTSCCINLLSSQYIWQFRNAYLLVISCILISIFFNWNDVSRTRQHTKKPVYHKIISLYENI